MTGHTKEPWRCGWQTTQGVTGPRTAATVSIENDVKLLPIHVAGGEADHAVAWLLTTDMGDDLEPDARRIVACVNACAGIQIADLETAGRLAAAEEATLQRLQQQRDALLEALRDARHCIAVDRGSLVECETNPVTGEIDPTAQAVVNEYDDILAKIDAAIGTNSGSAL